MIISTPETSLERLIILRRNLKWNISKEEFYSHVEWKKRR